jgi:bifunctional non-homologous end joining protein LigD
MTANTPSPQPIPSSIAPMLALASQNLPAAPQDFSFEYKWDGVRAITLWDGAHLRLSSRNDIDVTHRYPELNALGKALGHRPAILDGEIIAVDADHRPSFELLTHRMHLQDAQSIKRRACTIPVTYILFDLLYLDGRSTMPQPFTQRRHLLESLALSSRFWRISPAEVGEAEAMLASARQTHLEGIIAKRLDSPYEPGRRSGAWLKMKLVARQEFVIGGWIPEGKTNTHRVGALLLGYYDQDAVLHYAGRVGSGFDRQWHQRLTRQLHGREVKDSPFDERLARAPIHFVRPEVVAEIEYRRWPASGLLQQAAFKGIREDKPPGQVVDERAG